MSPPRSVVPVFLVLIGVLAGPPTLAVPGGGGSDPRSPDPETALDDGNRLFKSGRIEAAVEVYRRGYVPRVPRVPHPTLAYNLGTALHHLGRLPEAVLWYRRAGGSGDPWLEENLWLARRRLGSQVLPPVGPLGSLARQVDALRLAAIAAAWATFLALIAVRRFPLWGFLTSALLAGALYGAAAGVERWGPRPAVLVADCTSAAGEFPAGTEAWVRPLADGRFRVSGSAAVCDRETVELVFPQR